MSRTTRSAALFVCLAGIAVSPMYAAAPQPHPNSVKYRDAGAKPATGRSGSAAIQARALRGQTETDIEVTTGQFESTGPVGKLDKVQIKLFNNSGDVMVTDNYRKGALSGGYGSFTYDWPQRGTKLQVQANVSGIDANRTDVVTVDGTVALRPDLYVWRIYTQSQIYVGTNLTIDAVIRERNRDLGARANCVLKVDGVVADQANGIWVDAGDAVTCEFRKTFNELGTKQVTVEVANVTPADYNPNNNSRTIAIEVVKPTIPVWYYFSAFDDSDEGITYTTRHDEFQAADPSYLSTINDANEAFRFQQHMVGYQAGMQSPVAVTFPVTVESTFTVDGQAMFTPSFTVTPNMIQSGPGITMTCGDAYENYRWFRVCTYHYDSGADIADVSSSAQAGSVTYDGWSVGQIRYPDWGDVYVWESNWGPNTYPLGESSIPVPDTLGNNLVIHASVTDAANVHFDAEASVQLYPMPDSTDYWDNGCTSYDYSYDSGHYFGSSCSYRVTTAHGRAGWTYGTVYQ